MKRVLLVLPLVSFALTGCSSTKKPEYDCPQTAVIRELEHVKDFGNDTPDNSTLVATALMKSVKSQCKYKENGVDVEFDLTMLAGPGPRLGGDHISFPYFISVLDPERSIVSKEMMTAEFKLKEGQKMTDKTEELHVFIPLENAADGKDYQILMGFQLTEDQRKEIQKESARK